MPTKARQILDMLGVREGRRSFGDAVVGGDLGYGRAVGGGGGKGKYGTIFPPLGVEE